MKFLEIVAICAVVIVFIATASSSPIPVSLQFIIKIIQLQDVFIPGFVYCSYVWNL